MTDAQLTVAWRKECLVLLDCQLFFEKRQRDGYLISKCAALSVTSYSLCGWNWAIFYPLASRQRSLQICTSPWLLVALFCHTSNIISSCSLSLCVYIHLAKPYPPNLSHSFKDNYEKVFPSLLLPNHIAQCLF